jgi:hypothetical protein
VIGAAVGHTIMPIMMPIGSVIGGIAGGIIGSLGASHGARYIVDNVGDAYNYDIMEKVCINCNMEFKARKYRGNVDKCLCEKCETKLSISIRSKL